MPPRRAFAPVYEAAALRQPGIVFAKINVDQEHERARRYQIRSISALKVFREGNEVASRAGAPPAPSLDDLIAAAAH